jgi:signal recognition particle subunit SRP54
MFDNLTERLSDIFTGLRKHGALGPDDVAAALREIRVALLEADVALPVAKDFMAKVQERAVGQEVIRSITPAQQVVKIVHDTLVEMLGEANDGIDVSGTPPNVILMVGLQGSGKTTTTAKIALRLKTRNRQRVLLASLDISRPAAQEQLRILGEQVGVETLPIVAGQKPVEIAQRALAEARRGGFDVVMLDTAGRLAIDDELMAEVAAVRDASNPRETLLVADAMTGQDAVAVARIFNDRVGVTGIVLTRVDGDARGGAALSMRAVTGRPIKLLGVGEKVDALEDFHPERIAGRILGMGDVVSLVERAAETIDQEDAAKLAAKMEKGRFDLDDYAAQLRQMQKMGGMSGVMNLLPGMGQLKNALKDNPIDDRMIGHQQAIISSMTMAERRDIKILNASRRRRIALGSGTTVQDVNRLLKQFLQIQDVMKKMKKLGKAGLMRHGLKALMPGGFSDRR